MKTMNKVTNAYLSGKKLYGDDFTEDEIFLWYEKEKEGYADIYGESWENREYEYKNITNLHAYKCIKHVKHFDKVLGFGASWGYELYDIINKVNNLTILDPSTKTCSHKIGNVVPKYVIPSPTGIIPFEDNRFDLITCFGTLHHIPNVTFLMKELHRVLKPGGIICIREPIKSMGDWNYRRPGATACERGIPIKIFDKIISDLDFKIISRSCCYTCRGFFQRIFGYKFSISKGYNTFDKYLSKMLERNIHYHPTSFIEKLCPSMVFYV